jgi:REP element-mobilizing transposase RayT
VTSRGNERKEIFREDSDRQKFLGILADYHDRFGILIHSYVLLDNHYHLILETPFGNLVKIMHGINSRYTGYFNRKYQRVGHLFQGRYGAILVDKDAYLLVLSRYVHLNPIKAGITDNLERYSWSSYLGFIQSRKKVPWMEYDGVLYQFGNNQDLCRKKYKEYVYQGLRGKEKLKLGERILGPKEFIEKIQNFIKVKPIDQEIPGWKHLKKQVNPDEILKAVAGFWKMKEKEVTIGGQRNHTARKIAIYLIKRYCGLSNQEIGKFFGGLHYSAISQASARFSKVIERDKGLNNLIQQIRVYIKKAGNLFTGFDILS